MCRKVSTLMTQKYNRRYESAIPKMQPNAMEHCNSYGSDSFCIICEFGSRAIHKLYKLHAHIHELSSRKRGVGDRKRTVLPYPGRKRAADYRNQKRVVKVIKQFVTKLRRSTPPRTSQPAQRCPKALCIPHFLHSKITSRKDKKTDVLLHAANLPVGRFAD